MEAPQRYASSALRTAPRRRPAKHDISVSNVVRCSRSPRAGTELIGDTIDAQPEPKQQRGVTIKVDDIWQRSSRLRYSIGHPDPPHHLLYLLASSLPARGCGIGHVDTISTAPGSGSAHGSNRAAQSHSVARLDAQQRLTGLPSGLAPPEQARAPMSLPARVSRSSLRPAARPNAAAPRAPATAMRRSARRRRPAW
jgi:hypothetical protein